MENNYDRRVYKLTDLIREIRYLIYDLSQDGITIYSDDKKFIKEEIVAAFEDLKAIKTKKRYRRTN